MRLFFVGMSIFFRNSRFTVFSSLKVYEFWTESKEFDDRFLWQILGSVSIIYQDFFCFLLLLIFIGKSFVASSAHSGIMTEVRSAN